MSEEQPKKRRSLGWYVLLAIVALIVVVFVAVVLWRTFVPSANVWTNDAQIEAHYTTISPRVQGQIATVLVNDNEPVHKGQPLVKIDPRDYQTAVAAAKASLATAQASLAETRAEIARQPARIDQAQATVNKDQASAEFARRNADRYNTLARQHGISQEDRQRQDASARSAEAQTNADEAALADARKQLDVLKAQASGAEANLQQAQANLDQAKLNLSYTTIVAPEEGVITQRAARPGAWVNAGTALMAVVPLQRIYVLAHYRETELTHVAPGQKVSIHVDAFPNMKLSGHVDSLAPATGVTFSPVAPDNATGNFTKIVQRLPVKIAIDADRNVIARLKQGLSVETTIHTHYADVDSTLGIHGPTTDHSTPEAPTTP
ncbi:HlyD family secretion protein [Salinisphaera sp. Q1T1-3]|uniref:HlyD family secretion protein n=1 Tax=Salinisphaera sp. Q1T1-3 TaxID=2321229 RepID=UPI000E71711C|nr:HlyD family secretion protein [Salinisphaera sp. Q1T1-3]RJS91155.1 HlyD family secretion protein [Salinisphaera sp. Q1T1-3]